jgi:uncharacterized membrane protein
MHAGWNLLARFYRSERIFYKRMLGIILLVGLIPAVTSEIATRSITPLAWVCLVGSGFSASIYLYFLARAYEEADFTVVYPIARSLPVIFVAFGDLLRGRYLTMAGWIGLLLVASGNLLVPMRSFEDFKVSNYLNRASLWMLLAASGTVGYTLLDKIAAEGIQPGAATAARYGYMYFAISFLPYSTFMKISKPVSQNPRTLNWKIILAAALLSFSAYWLILWAYQLTPLASYIVAFRQFSIVIGAILAFIIFKEQGLRVRLSGAALITSGLLLIALWGR